MKIFLLPSPALPGLNGSISGLIGRLWALDSNCLSYMYRFLQISGPLPWFKFGFGSIALHLITTLAVA